MAVNSTQTRTRSNARAGRSPKTPATPVERHAQARMAEMHDLIIELRSATQGVGTFDWTFDHLAELTGKSADKIAARTRPEEAKAAS